MRRHIMRARRAVRRFALGSGPLKRGTDRLQMLCRIALLLTLIASAPAAVWAAAVTRDHLSSVAAEQVRTRSATRATLVESATGPSAAAPAWSDYSVPVASTAARWTTPAGGVRTGRVLAPVGTAAGTTVPIWVTAEGSLTTAPVSAQTITDDTITAAYVTVTSTAVVAWALYALAVWGLTRRRDRQWTEAWAAVAPVWTSHPR